MLRESKVLGHAGCATPYSIPWTPLKERFQAASASSPTGATLSLRSLIASYRIADGKSSNTSPAAAAGRASAKTERQTAVTNVRVRSSFARHRIPCLLAVTAIVVL